MSKTNATVHLDVSDEEPPKFHCVYNANPGEFSIKVAGSDVTVYVCGTADTLRTWATQFLAATIDGVIAVNEQARETTDD
jgi:hypothetical protein